MIDVLPVAREPEYHDRCSTSSSTARLDSPTTMISVPALSSPFILLMLPVTRRVPLSSRSSPATFSPSSVPFRRWSSHVLRFVVPVFHHPSIGGRPYYDANGCKLHHSLFRQLSTPPSVSNYCQLAPMSYRSDRPSTRGHLSL